MWNSFMRFVDIMFYLTGVFAIVSFLSTKDYSAAAGICLLMIITNFVCIEPRRKRIEALKEDEEADD